MTTRGIIGRKIKAVRQFRPGNACKVAGMVVVAWIELDNGVRLIPLVMEGESEYFVELVVNKRGCHRKQTKTERTQ